MCDLKVELDAIAPGRDFTPEFENLAPLVEAGMVHVDARTVGVSEQGRPFVRLAAAAFDAYLPQNRTRHSVAV
jgi:oxygen-independent coproporphyrinogen-3 oxidase